ncbi:Uncharacterized protein APZ42_002301 [Daphnia magna]|uniref:Uncharacterized protein n=1 Tax=Daphnia magna TaxID=35525 RepID=A0A164ID10_9CRUS|nr:Uncharacterized protein APZ42_002301 [Daphnia magna]
MMNRRRLTAIHHESDLVFVFWFLLFQESFGPFSFEIAIRALPTMCRLLDKHKYKKMIQFARCIRRTMRKGGGVEATKPDGP